ncbi:MAG: Holliday junction branch migration protein RuvA [Propionibacteriaceae bacterium]|nr:Holliday junction branch migration protein RuvA [Propionibacteriaceae bacterium]
MIAHVTGTVTDVRATSAVVDVSGIGFTISCTPAATAGLTVGERGHLSTHMVVREDSWTLYGFSSDDEKDAFVLVQSVTGIGPKLALAIVSCLTPQQLRQALLTGNLAALSSVPGVGTKVAQRLVLELKDKAMTLSTTVEEEQVLVDSAWKEQVLLGLVGLGYSAKDAEKAWDAVSDQAHQPSMTVSELMRSALRSLARG